MSPAVRVLKAFWPLLKNRGGAGLGNGLADERAAGGKVGVQGPDAEHPALAVGDGNDRAGLERGGGEGAGAGNRLGNDGLNVGQRELRGMASRAVAKAEKCYEKKAG